ncbi:MAG: diguanylate cyclase [Acidobacteriota bacterium]
MELGTLQIQIFVSLVVVLGTAFVAFLCDFLKGNNEQLRERNIEMRVRQDERERLGVAHPGSLLKGIEALLLKTPALRVGPAEETVAAPAPAETETQQPATWEQPIVAPAARGSAWASKEELEKLAERAARIRERHESRKATDDDLTEEDAEVEEPIVLASITEMPAEAGAELEAETIAEVQEPAAETAAETLAVEEVIAAEAAPPVAEEIIAAEIAPAVAEETIANEEVPVVAEETIASEAVPVVAEETIASEVVPVVAEETFASEAVPVVSEETISAEADPAEVDETVTTEAPLTAAAAAFETLVEPVAEPITEIVSHATQETPPPLVAAEAAAHASAEAEATPVLEPAEIEPAGLEFVAEADEPASHIELQSLAASRMPAVEAPPAGLVARGDEPAAIASGPELVMKPMGFASIIPSEPEEFLEQDELAEASESEFEPELLRVRVVQIDQTTPDVEQIIESIVQTPDEPAAEAVVAEQASEPLPPAEELAAAEPAQPETVLTNVADLENAADIGSLHESLVAEEAGLPRGLHAAEVLREQIKANAPFQGVAVSIGINDFEALKQKLDTPGGADSLAAIEKMIRGMLKEPDFACHFQDDEFILLFPGEADSAAQRRLFQISEKLWDFQLRSLGHHSIMFSWGGLEVKRDSLSDAVSSARERMFQTKRNRTGAIEMRKRVVNG